MPTGYTAIIEEKPDLTLREFTLRCARAFGPCIDQREESYAQPPRVPELSTYHLEAKRRCESRLVELRSLTPKTAQVLFDAECQQEAKESAERVKHAAELERRYKAMRAKVDAWVPPTKDHAALKKFMLEQIDRCESDWKNPYIFKRSGDAATWLTARIQAEEENVAYHTKKHAEEVERHAERKRWIETLYASFGAPA
jgi:hypothetical protein